MYPGMIPILHYPNLIIPEQLRPTTLDLLCMFNFDQIMLGISEMGSNNFSTFIDPEIWVL